MFVVFCMTNYQPYMLILAFCRSIFPVEQEIYKFTKCSRILSIFLCILLSGSIQGLMHFDTLGA